MDRQSSEGWECTATAPRPCLFVQDCAALTAAGIAFDIRRYMPDRWSISVPSGMFDAGISACEDIQ